MNQVTVMGHLGSDPEVKFTSSGQKVTSFRLASNMRKGGNEETIWWRVTLWGEQFDKKMAYIKKGTPLIVSGQMQKPKVYVDRQGASQISLDLVAYHVEFSPFGKGGSADSGSLGQGQPQKGTTEGYPAPSFGYKGYGTPPQGNLSLGGEEMGQGEEFFSSGEIEEEEIPF